MLNDQGKVMSRLPTVITVFLLLSVVAVPHGLSEETSEDDNSTASIIISEILASPMA